MPIKNRRRAIHVGASIRWPLVRAKSPMVPRTALRTACCAATLGLLGPASPPSMLESMPCVGADLDGAALLEHEAEVTEDRALQPPAVGAFDQRAFGEPLAVQGGGAGDVGSAIPPAAAKGAAEALHGEAQVRIGEERALGSLRGRGGPRGVAWLGLFPFGCRAGAGEETVDSFLRRRRVRAG